MTTTKDLLNLTQDMQGLSLLSENIKHTKNKKKKKNLASLAVKNIVGIELLKTQADISAGI